MCLHVGVLVFRYTVLRDGDMTLQRSLSLFNETASKLYRRYAVIESYSDMYNSVYVTIHCVD